MKIPLLSILVIIMTSCMETDKPVFFLVKQQEINRIVEAVILKDSIPIFKDESEIRSSLENVHSKMEKDKISRKFNVDLKQLTVLFSTYNQNKIPLPIPPNSIEFKSLITFQQPDSSTFFLMSDSTYIQFQNKHPQRLSYTGELLDQLNVVETIEQPNQYDTYYSISLPIISENQKVAYLEVTYHCKGLCGETIGYMLFKQSDTWTIIGKKTIWMS